MLAAIMAEEAGSINDLPDRADAPENFRAEIRLATGNDTYGAGADWREANHDDLVLAVALATWVGEDEVAQQAGASVWGDRWALPEVED